MYRERDVYIYRERERGCTGMTKHIACIPWPREGFAGKFACLQTRLPICLPSYPVTYLVTWSPSYQCISCVFALLLVLVV